MTTTTTTTTTNVSDMTRDELASEAAAFAAAHPRLPHCADGAGPDSLRPFVALARWAGDMERRGERLAELQSLSRRVEALTLRAPRCRAKAPGGTRRTKARTSRRRIPRGPLDAPAPARLSKGVMLRA